ncbi:MAG: CvpA family protein [Spirochaetaceae bacterium]|nr:CvpA family protein [Spirochaetaceae bacterium]MBO4705332.1 CvpA family protein [Spirochaetaceae bacterium]
MNLAFIDIFFIVILIFTVINAAIKGFIHEFFSKAAFFLGIFLAAVFYPKLDVYMRKGIKIEILSKIVSFLLIFIVVYIVMRLIQLIVKKAFSGEIMSGLDHSLGVFVGIAEGFAIIALILGILYMQPWFDVSDLLHNSIFHKMLKGILSSPVNEIKEIVSNV